MSDIYKIIVAISEIAFHYNVLAHSLPATKNDDGTAK